MVTLSKAAARQLVAERLNTMSEHDYQTGSDTVREQVRELLARLCDSGKVHAVLSYHAQPKWREVDVAPLEQEFSGAQFDYVQPGIKAPFPTRQYDVIIVPLYGFNAEGYRLGHGGGWYDQFLRYQPNALKIGVGLDVGLVRFYYELHDVPMDLIITD